MNNKKVHYDASNLDTKICIGLADEDGWWGNMLSWGEYQSSRGDLAADYHDYCRLNSLDPHVVSNADRFLKQVKMEQKLNKIAEDF